ALLSADEAISCLAIGDWRRCVSRLRFALGSDPGPFADTGARLAAARLAAWQGRPVEAQAHMERIDELVAGNSSFLNYEYDGVRAEVLLAAGRPQAAYDAALDGATTPGVPPTMCEWLMPLAARALADLVRADRDAGRDAAGHLARLDDLVSRFPTVIRDFGEFGEQWTVQIAALDELYAAEVGRARQSPDNGAQWVRAAEGCRAGMLAWEEAYACWRAAEAMLMHDRHQRASAASLLRRGHGLATDLRARPVRIEMEALAATARIPLEPVQAVPDAAPQGSGGSTALAALTPREREVLAHVVAGRTYAEIARDMVISEKTVSSHISNLLRKTGTSSRVELARLAARTSQPSA
ncbi:MAG: LuxR C-terminal-related transcriptional regulator, partial [Aeromicrobium sp.]